MPIGLKGPKGPFLPDVARTRGSEQSGPRQPKTRNGWLERETRGPGPPIAPPPQHPSLAEAIASSLAGHRDPPQGPLSGVQLGPGSWSAAPSHTHPHTLASASPGQLRREEIIPASHILGPNRLPTGHLEYMCSPDRFSATPSKG